MSKNGNRKEENETKKLTCLFVTGGNFYREKANITPGKNGKRDQPPPPKKYSCYALTAWHYRTRISQNTN